MEFIDTHNHILPGIDDGPADIESSIAMARIAADDGITTIVATPHVIEGLYEGRDLDSRIASLQQELDVRDIAVRLVPGAEVPMSICMSGDSPLLEQLAIGGRYVLMESAETTFDQLTRAVYQVRLSGYFPVLAHPERTTYARRNIEELAEMSSRDELYCQLTVASLDGTFGPGPRKNCTLLARQGLVHLLASDAHSTGRRAPRLSESFRELSRIAGEELASLAVRDNPRRMIGGDKLITPAGGEPRRHGSLLRRFFRNPGA